MTTSPVITNLLRALTGPFLKRSVGVALVVGTLLNVINQWDACFGAASFVWMQALLTYCVPFGVSTYGTVSAFLAQDDARSLT